MADNYTMSHRTRETSDLTTRILLRQWTFCVLSSTLSKMPVFDFTVLESDLDCGSSTWILDSGENLKNFCVDGNIKGRQSWMHFLLPGQRNFYLVSRFSSSLMFTRSSTSVFNFTILLESVWPKIEFLHLHWR